jgi:hypothetical protein
VAFGGVAFGGAAFVAAFFRAGAGAGPVALDLATTLDAAGRPVAPSDAGFLGPGRDGGGVCRARSLGLAIYG